MRTKEFYAVKLEGRGGEEEEEGEGEGRNYWKKMSECQGNFNLSNMKWQAMSIA